MSIRNLLGEARIPMPSRIMAELIALKIAQLPPEPNAPYKANEGIKELSLRDGRKIEISIDDRDRQTIRVGLPGAPAYRTVELNTEEQQIIFRELLAWEDRSLKVHFANQEADSQDAALEILEGLI